MQKMYKLIFNVSNRDDLKFSAHKAQIDRLEEALDADSTLCSEHFFIFDTADGNTVALNLTDVQAVRFLEEATPQAELPQTTRVSLDLLKSMERCKEAVLQICLRDRVRLLEVLSKSPKQIFNLFEHVSDFPADTAPFHILDVNGELLALSLKEIVWICVPTRFHSEGFRLVESGGKECAMKPSIHDEP